MAEVKAEEVKAAVDELRKTVETYGAESTEVKAIMEKVEETLKTQEDASAKVVADLMAEVKAREAIEEQVKTLELEIAKGTYSGGKKGDYKETPEYNALAKYFQFGDAGLDADEKLCLVTSAKTMRMDDSTQGGYLTTTEMDNVIIKKITEISPVRQVARVKNVGKKTLDVPKRESIPVATYEGEAAAGDDDNSTYGSEQLTAYRLTVTVPYTMDILGDSAFDLEAEVNNDVSEAFAFKEGNKFVLGTGSKQPEGFLVHPAIIAGARETAGSSTISGDDLLLLTGDLKVGYNPMYSFNRQTLAFLRTLKGSDGQYLWQASLAPNVPNTIAGEPYVVMQDMPSIATGALSVMYADFLRGYLIIDRTGMVIIRDEVTRKKFAIIELTFHRWNHGQVVLPEAFKALKIAA